MSLVVKNVKQIVSVVEGNVSIISGPTDIFIRDGLISKISEPDATTSLDDYSEVINAQDLCVIPGLIDAHTHPVFAGDRCHEFAAKLAGATYMDIMKKGGGINFTSRSVRQATPDELYRELESYLWRMLRAGTTTVECKSGYGAGDFETELKMLQVIERARRDHPIGISATFLPAHSIAEGSTASKIADDIVSRQIPEVAKIVQSGNLHVDNIDVFCEKGVYEIDDSRRILAEGMKHGLNANFHADELFPLGGAGMGAKIGARAMSHLECISDSDITSMAKAGCHAVVLPSTAYILRLTPPPVRKMLDAGVKVCLGSDFNPNAFCLSMPMVMHLACVNFKMTMDEALIAATVNAASCLGIQESRGTIEVGKAADLLLLDAPSWQHLIYQFGCHDHVIKHVIKDGVLVYTRPW